MKRRIIELTSMLESLNTYSHDVYRYNITIGRLEGYLQCMETLGYDITFNTNEEVSIIISKLNNGIWKLKLKEDGAIEYQRTPEKKNKYWHQ